MAGIVGVLTLMLVAGMAAGAPRGNAPDPAAAAASEGPETVVTPAAQTPQPTAKPTPVPSEKPGKGKGKGKGDGQD
jgi:hypothetical protein